MDYRIKDKDKKWESHEFEDKNLRFSIHHHINWENEDWLLSCHDVFGSRQQLLPSKNIDIAKKEAVALIRTRLKSMLSSLD
ncbi:hypothetical protein KAR91_46685 [Candidatus Pacearchaeota archaeon]|nr:hypothetical protein [Candidatus Pacearchaeota archaeon]